MDKRDQKAAEEEKIHLERRIQQSRRLEAIGTLAGGIAHDFNNILSAVIGFTELAIYEIDDKEKAKKNLKEVLAAGERAKELTKQILTFSRMSESEYDTVLLDRIIEDSLKMLRSVIPANIDIKQNLNVSGYVMSNPNQITQIMLNLCSSAAQSMDAAGGTIDITLERISLDRLNNPHGIEVQEGIYLKITVSDNGKGMTREMRERIFEPYFAAGNRGIGSGLDLSVIHGIVKSHSGDIICRENNYGGTAFEVYLPETEKGEEDITPQVENNIETGNGRILVIDDDPVLVQLVVEMLEIMGYDVLSSVSSKEGLRMFRNAPDDYDVVITDMTMPEINGDVLAKEILSIRSDIPVILCTGFNEHISEAEAKEIGISEFVMKPVNMKTLSGIIQRVLEKE